MKLSQADAELFFKLMWGLQLYVSQQRQVLPNVNSIEEFAGLSSSDKLEVRAILWDNPDLIEKYVTEDPDGLAAEDLDIIRKWDRFVKGTFQVFRFLKKHTIFIGDDLKVYGVLGLHDAIEDMFPDRRPPVMVQAVLLPFKGKIVYDGLLQGYSIFFGGGIKSSLNEGYMVAKQNNLIITTLEPELAAPVKPKSQRPATDWGAAIDEVVKATTKMKGGPAVQSAAFGLLRASAKLAQAVVLQPDDSDELWRLEQQVRRALSRLQTTLNRAEW